MDDVREMTVNVMDKVRALDLMHASEWERALSAFGQAARDGGPDDAVVYASHLGRVGRTLDREWMRDKERRILDDALVRWPDHIGVMLARAALMPWSAERMELHKRALDRGISRRALYEAWKCALAIGHPDASHYCDAYERLIGRNAEWLSLSIWMDAIKRGEPPILPDIESRDVPISDGLIEALRNLRWNRSYSGPRALLWRTPLDALLITCDPTITAWRDALADGSTIRKAWGLRGTSFPEERPHIHDGSTSIVVHVVVPNEISDDNHAGWLELGRPDFPVPFEPIVHVVKPIAGRAILFTSPLYHRVIAGAFDSERMSVAIEVA